MLKKARLVILNLGMCTAMWASNASAARYYSTFALRLIVDCSAPSSERMHRVESSEDLCVSRDVIVDGSNLADVSVERDEYLDAYDIHIWLDNAGAKRMSSATRKMKQNGRIGIVLDAQLISAPFIMGHVSKEMLITAPEGGEKLKKIVKAIRSSMKSP